MKRKISNKLIKQTKKWLRQEGIDFFREVKEKYGCIDAVWNEGEFGKMNEEPERGLKAAIIGTLGSGKIPHAVHFREGRLVRNFMRQSGLCKKWNDLDYDDNWVELIEECIK